MPPQINQRRPQTSFWFLFLAIGVLAIGFAWKFDWLPIDFSEGETGTIADVTDDDNSPNIPSFETPENSLETPHFQPVDDQPNQPDAGLPFQPEAAPAAAQNDTTSFLNEQSEPISRSKKPPFEFFPGKRNNSQPVDEGNRGVVTAAYEAPNFANDPTTASIERNIRQTGNDTSASTSTDVASTTNRTATSKQVKDASAFQQKLQVIDQLIEAQEDIKAHRELSQLYWNNPDLRPLFQDRIEQSARRIYFSPQPHYMPPIKVKFGDRLEKLAAPYRVSWQYLAQLNNIAPRSIREGQKLKVIKGPFSAYVDLSDFELTVHAHGYFVRRYTVGIGKMNSSPLGKFKVLNKVENPEYTDPQGRRVAPDDPTNPLGEYWLDIGDSFGIHGTIEPKSIGKAASRGCVRMHNDDVAQVYHLLTKGSEVIIRR